MKEHHSWYVPSFRHMNTLVLWWNSPHNQPRVMMFYVTVRLDNSFKLHINMCFALQKQIDGCENNNIFIHSMRVQVNVSLIVAK